MVEIDVLIRKPGSTIESLFWQMLYLLRIAKRKQEQQMIEKLEEKKMWGQKLFTVPNILSASRSFPLAPFFYFSVRYGLPKAVSISIVVLAGLTDWLDGILARKWGTSKQGGMIDACSDKVFMAICLIALYPLMFPSLFWTVLGIETLLLALALIAIYQIHTGQLPRSTNTDSVGFGKWKYAAQCTAVLALLAGNHPLGNRLFLVAAGLAVLSIIWKGRQIYTDKKRAP